MERHKRIAINFLIAAELAAGGTAKTALVIKPLLDIFLQILITLALSVRQTLTLIQTQLLAARLVRPTLAP